MYQYHSQQTKKNEAVIVTEKFYGNESEQTKIYFRQTSKNIVKETGKEKIFTMNRPQVLPRIAYINNLTQYINTITEQIQTPGHEGQF
jgi:hypothetical protein